MAAARARDIRHREAGLSLAELVVAMGVASILMVAIGVVFGSTMRGVTMLQVKNSTTADARIVMEAMTRSVRVAFKPTSTPEVSAAIGTARAKEIIFYALLNRSGSAVTETPQPTKVRYWWQDNCIRQTLTPAVTDGAGSVSWPSSGDVTTCLARTNSDPIFTYFASGSGTTQLTVPPGGSLDEGNRKLIRSVGISVDIAEPGQSRVKGVQMVGRVTLTNLVADDNNTQTDS